MADLKRVACDAIDAAASDLHKLSDEIWNHPELAHEEARAHDTLTQFLTQQGFEVEKSYQLKTAFRATFGFDKGPHICTLCEYDALPEIGHACGHNLIAEVGAAAGIGIMAAIKARGGTLGKVTVLGAPAEEQHGGKIDLIKAGAFNDVDVAMMAHPDSEDDHEPIMLAVEGLLVTFTGKAAHAAGFPWEGVNALDAVCVCYQSISCLRQQMKPDWRVHCIFLMDRAEKGSVGQAIHQKTFLEVSMRADPCLPRGIVKEGGVRTNIIPERASLEVSMRAPTDSDLNTLKEKIIACFNAAATATGCQFSYEISEPRYSSVVHNKQLVQLYESNLAILSAEKVPTIHSGVSGSTDMGNVSHVVPSIHPEFYIGGPGTCHTREFTTSTGAPEAQKWTLLQAKVLALTAIDVMLDPELLKRVKSAFEEDMKTRA